MSQLIAPLQAVFQVLIEVDAVTKFEETTPEGKKSCVGKKIRPDALRKGDVPPFIAIEVQDDNSLNDMDGYGGQGTATVTVTCVCASREASIALTNLVNPLLSNYRGTVNGTRIDHSILQGPPRGYEPPQDGSDQSHGFYVVLTYSVMYTTGVS